MQLCDIPKIILADSQIPLSAREIWDEAVKRGLDKAVVSKGKTPDASIAAYLYTKAKREGSEIVAQGAKPVRFRIRVAEAATSAPPAIAQQPILPAASQTIIPPTPNDGDKKQGSMFLGKCLEVLQANSPSPMGVGQILKAILAAHPELPWKHANGAIRAALIRAAKHGETIKLVTDSIPPKFFVKSAATEAKPQVQLPHAPQPTSNTFSFLKCAEEVLREFGGQQPMHYRDITKKALELGWLVSDGTNPENTMCARLGDDIRNRSTSGQKQRFVRNGRGYFGLAEWIDPIQNEIDRHNAQMQKMLLGKLREMSPTDFENLLRRLLDEMDFLDTEVTKASGDGGIDVRGTWKVADGILIKMAIQAKRWKANIQAPIVQAVRGALKGSERGMIITTSDFSKGAREEADDPSKASTISLVNGEQLVKLLVQYGIGVKRKNIEILELDKDFGLTPCQS